MVFPLQYNMCCLSFCQICNSFIYTERRREANSSIQALSLSLRCTYYSCTAHCVCYTQHSSKAHWKIYRTTTTNWLFSSLSLSVLTSSHSPLCNIRSMREPANYREGSAPRNINNSTLLCCPSDTVNDNQWTNNNLAGLIMRTMLTQQLVIHWSICQYCTAEQRVVLSRWKRNNSV